MAKTFEGWKGSIRQVNDDPPLFQVYWRENGKKKFFTKGYNREPFRTEAQAVSFLSAVNSPQAKMPFWNPDRLTRDTSYDFGKLAQKWVDHSTCEIEWKEKRKRIVENLFIPFFGVRTDIRNLSDRIPEFHLHLKAKGLAPKTVRNYMLELKCFFNSQKKIIPPDKFPEFKIKKVQPRDPERLTPQEQDEIFSFIPEHHLPIFVFMKYTGCRPNEAGGLLKRYVDIKEQEFKFVKALGKGKRIKDTKTRQAPKPFELIPPLYEVIEPLMDKPGEFVFYTPAGNPYTVRRLEKIWDTANAKATKKFGTKRINLYNGHKHTFVFNRLDEGYPLDEVMGVTRHTSPQTLKIYGDYSKRQAW